MAVIITPDEVKEVINTPMTCSMIQHYIDSIEEKIGACLNANYQRATCTLIKLNLVAYQIAVVEGHKDISNQRAPNGAAITFSSAEMGKSGLLSNQYGRAVFNLDTSMCWKGLVKSRIMFGVIGNPTNQNKSNY
jgi:hypothetical protein